MTLTTTSPALTKLMQEIQAIKRQQTQEMTRLQKMARPQTLQDLARKTQTPFQVQAVSQNLLLELAIARHAEQLASVTAT